MDRYCYPDAYFILRSVKITDDLSMKCQEQLIQRWIFDKYSPFAVFKIVDDGHNRYEVLTNPIWNQYLEAYNKANEGSKFNEIDLLVRYYGQNGVLQILAEMTVNDMEELASKLSAQYQAKYSAQNVHSSN